MESPDGSALCPAACALSDGKADPATVLLSLLTLARLRPSGLDIIASTPLPGQVRVANGQDDGCLRYPKAKALRCRRNYRGEDASIGIESHRENAAGVAGQGGCFSRMTWICNVPQRPDQPAVLGQDRGGSDREDLGPEAARQQPGKATSHIQPADV